MFLSTYFSFQIRKDLGLGQVLLQYNSSTFFWKLLENLQGNDCDGNYFQESLNYSKWTQVRESFYQFFKYLFMIASKHWTEMHSFEWQPCLVLILPSHQRFVKKGSLFIKYPENTFLFSLRANFTYFLKCIPLKRKKKKPSWLWCFGASNCFIIGGNMRKQALSKNLNAAHSRQRKSNSRFMKPWK